MTRAERLKIPSEFVSKTKDFFVPTHHFSFLRTSPPKKCPQGTTDHISNNTTIGEVSACIGKGVKYYFRSIAVYRGLMGQMI